MKSFAKQAWYWRMAVMRVFLYMSFVYISTYLTLTETFSSSQWAELGQFLKNRLHLSCLVPALGALLAFMDSTMSRLQQAQEDREKHITTVTTETSGPDKPVEPPLKTD